MARVTDEGLRQVGELQNAGYPAHPEALVVCALRAQRGEMFQTIAIGMLGVKGYRTMGGIRVSMYNASTMEHVRTLVQFMEEFVRTNG